MKDLNYDPLTPRELAFRRRRNQFVVTVVIVLAIIAGLSWLRSTAATPAPKTATTQKTATISLDQTVCYSFPGLERSGWKMVSYEERHEIGHRVADRKARVIEAMTLTCVDYSSCPAGARPGCELKTIPMRAKLWEPIRLPARAVSPHP